MKPKQKNSYLTPYNLYLASPQLAYQANKNQQYKCLIFKNFQDQYKYYDGRYPASYFRTAYNRVYLSNQSSGVPY